MNRSTHIVFLSTLLLSLFGLLAQGQKPAPKWSAGDEYQHPNEDVRVRHMARDADGTIWLFKCDGDRPVKNWTVDRFSPDLKRLSSDPLKLPGGDYSDWEVVGIIPGGKVHLVLANWPREDSGKVQVAVATPDAKGAMAKPVAVADVVCPAKKDPQIWLGPSFDSTHWVLGAYPYYLRKGEKPLLGFVVLDREGAAVWKDKMDVSSGEKEVFVNRLGVSNDGGRVFGMVSAATEWSEKKSDLEQVVLLVERGKPGLSRTVLTQKEKILFDPFFIEAKDGTVRVVSGYCSAKEIGLFFKRLHPTWFSEGPMPMEGYASSVVGDSGKIALSPFLAETFAFFSSKTGISNLRGMRVVPAPGNKAWLCLEACSRTDFSGQGAHGDVFETAVVLCLDEDGKRVCEGRLPKRAGYCSALVNKHVSSGFGAVPKGDNLLFVYNDNADNLKSPPQKSSKLSEAIGPECKGTGILLGEQRPASAFGVMHVDGGTDKSLLFKFSEEKLYLSPDCVLRYDDSTLVCVGMNGRDKGYKLYRINL